MVREIDIEYQGTPLEVEYELTKGKGSYGRSQPPEEDEVKILKAKLPDGSEMSLDDTGTRWDIEMMILEKIID